MGGPLLTVLDQFGIHRGDSGGGHCAEPPRTDSARCAMSVLGGRDLTRDEHDPRFVFRPPTPGDPRPGISLPDERELLGRTRSDQASQAAAVRGLHVQALGSPLLRVLMCREHCGWRRVELPGNAFDARVAAPLEGMVVHVLRCRRRLACCMHWPGVRRATVRSQDAGRSLVDSRNGEPQNHKEQRGRNQRPHERDNESPHCSKRTSPHGCCIPRR